MRHVESAGERREIEFHILAVDGHHDTRVLAPGSGRHDPRFLVGPFSLAIFTFAATGPTKVIFSAMSLCSP
jgi:hypothetical protein